METALGDSQRFEIFSVEEIDELKKQQDLLSVRIEATKRKLVLDSKLRDAALSLNRLHSSSGKDNGAAVPGSSPKRHRRSFRGSKGSSSDLLGGTDDELITSTKRCEELAQELWKLEKRAQEIQRKLLEHTAGVLQMTHKGFLSREAPPNPVDEVENLDGYEMTQHLDGSYEFDDRSFYKNLDAMLDLGNVMKGEGNSHSAEEFTKQTQTILETERRLEDLNQRMRDSILESTARSRQLAAPPSMGETEQDPTLAIQEQLDYLEKGFGFVQEDHSKTLANTKRIVCAAEERLEDLNTQLHGMINRSDHDPNAQFPVPPEVSGQSPEAQIRYLETGLDTVEQTMQRLDDASRSLSSRSAFHEEKAGQFETVVLGLWDIVVAGEEELRQPNQQRQGKVSKDSNESPTAHVNFSLQDFSAKVQSLCARVTGLSEQKEILAKQIQQQRELNSQSEVEKDARFSDLSIRLDQAKSSLERKEAELKSLENEATALSQRLDAAQQETQLREQQRELGETRALEVEKEARKEMEEHYHTIMQAKQQEIANLEAAIKDSKDRSSDTDIELLATLKVSEERVHDLSSELGFLKKEIETRQADEEILKRHIEQKNHKVEKMQGEMERLEAEVVRLRTEVTVAKAELDGAYGTRAQRAAEVASNPALQRELDDLSQKNSSLLSELEVLKAQHENATTGNTETTQRVQVLQQELSEMVGEYEAMTKSSIEFEREREQLEAAIDGLRDRCESLESELSDEKVRWLGVKNPGSSGSKDSGAPGTTSTMVLKNEFKKMMRETRAENSRALRVSFKIDLG